MDSCFTRLPKLLDSRQLMRTWEGVLQQRGCSGKMCVWLLGEKIIYKNEFLYWCFPNGFRFKAEIVLCAMLYLLLYPLVDIESDTHQQTLRRKLHFYWSQEFLIPTVNVLLLPFPLLIGQRHIAQSFIHSFIEYVFAIKNTSNRDRTTGKIK